jgi:hypothetical protein
MPDILIASVRESTGGVFAADDAGRSIIESSAP